MQEILFWYFIVSFQKKGLRRWLGSYRR